MTRKEWKDSVHSLRKLIREGLKQPEEGSRIDRRVEYKFALVYNSRYSYFHLWNGKTKNTIATIKISGERVFVRYRKSSWYAGIIQNISLPNRQMIFVESKDLGRHRGFVESRIGDRMERSIADFLVREDRAQRQSETSSLRMWLPVPQETIYGQNTAMNLQQHGVEFEIRVPSTITTSEQQSLYSMVQDLVTMGVAIPQVTDLGTIQRLHDEFTGVTAVDMQYGTTLNYGPLTTSNLATWNGLNTTTTTFTPF